MSQAIGELLLQSGNPLLKMWNIYVPPTTRAYVKHSHTRFEITVVNSGSGLYQTEKEVYPMLPGDVFVFSSNEIHCITEAGEKGLDITNLHFEPRYLNREFSESLGSSYLSFCFSHSDSFRNRIPGEKAGVLRMHHWAIRDEFGSGREQYPLAIRSHLHLMLIELLRNHDYPAPSLPNGSAMIQSILDVYDHIDLHLSDDLSLKGLAEVAGLSPNYFSHIFKKLNGISLWDHINAKRIERAIHLIRTEGGSLAMTQIAMECGFNSTVNFNKAFKKQTGITPTQLKKDPKILNH